MEMMLILMYTVNFVSAAFFSIVVLLELLFMICQVSPKVTARLNHFLKLFKHCNVLPSLMSSPLKSASTTYFDVHCDHILDAIRKHRWSGKQKYFDTFSLKKNGKK